jgi:hypothetical protein
MTVHSLAHYRKRRDDKINNNLRILQSYKIKSANTLDERILTLQQKAAHINDLVKRLEEIEKGENDICVL